MFPTGAIVRQKPQEHYNGTSPLGKPHVVLGESHNYGGIGKYIIVAPLVDGEVQLTRTGEWGDWNLEQVGTYEG